MPRTTVTTSSSRFDEAIVDFSVAYADQAEPGCPAPVASVRTGRITAYQEYAQRDALP